MCIIKIIPTRIIVTQLEYIESRGRLNSALYLENRASSIGPQFNETILTPEYAIRDGVLLISFQFLDMEASTIENIHSLKVLSKKLM